MEQSPSSEANNHAASQEIPLLVWNPKVHYRVHNEPPLVPIHAMKAYWGCGSIVPYILTSAVNGGEWSYSRLSHFTPGERGPGNH